MSAIHNKEVELNKKLKEIVQLSSDAISEKEKCSPSLKTVNELHEKIQNDQKITIQLRSKLKSACVQCLNDTESQKLAFKKILDKIQEVRKLEDEIKTLRGHAIMRRGVLMNLLQEKARTIPVWIGKPDEKCPPLCGSIPASPNYCCEVGSRVAALVTEPEESGEGAGESWILAEVRRVQNNSYVVDDIDIEEGKEAKSYVLDKKKVIPLPLWKANPVTNPEAIFPKGRLVLALYPQTTCFYRALVEDVPSHIHDDYSLFFEDPSYPEGYAPPLKIPQKYVIDCVDV